MERVASRVRWSDGAIEERGTRSLVVETERHASTTLSCLEDNDVHDDAHRAARERERPRRGRMTSRKSITWTENAMVRAEPSAAKISLSAGFIVIVILVGLFRSPSYTPTRRGKAKRYRIYGRLFPRRTRSFRSEKYSSVSACNSGTRKTVPLWAKRDRKRGFVVARLSGGGVRRNFSSSALLLFSGRAERFPFVFVSGAFLRLGNSHSFYGNAIILGPPRGTSVAARRGARFKRREKLASEPAPSSSSGSFRRSRRRSIKLLPRVFATLPPPRPRRATEIRCDSICSDGAPRPSRRSFSQERARAPANDSSLPIF